MANGYVNGRPDEVWWMTQIRKGIAYRKKYAREADWARWRQYYRGYWPRGTLPVNLFFRMLRTVVPRVYFRNPSISVQPSKHGIEQQVFARLIERIDNKLIRTMRVKNQVKQIVQDTWMFGTGIGKRGFGQEFHPTPDMITGGSDPFAKDSTMRVKAKTEYHSTIRDNMPWFLENPTGGFIVPAGSRNFLECRWYAGWYRRPLEDLQEDPRFKNTAMLKGSHHSEYRASPLPDMSEGPTNEIDLVEIRDTKTGKAFVIAPYGETDKKVLFYGDDTMQVNGRTPFYTTVFNPDDEVCWGVPDSVVLEPQQLELNEIRTLTMKHRRLAIVKLLYKDKSLDTTELEKVLNGEVLAAVKVNGELSDIEFRQMADIPKDLFMAGNEVLNDVRENMGFSRNQFGNYAEGSADRTATESRIVQTAREIRVDERRDAVADLIVDLFEDIHVDIFDRWSDEIVVQVAGADGLPVWVAFKPNMLKAAQYEIQVDPDSSVPETKEVRMQKALVTYERLKTNPLIDPQLLTTYLLHELHGTQFDTMMRTLGQLAQQQSAGVQGSTQENPLSAEQLDRKSTRLNSS